MLGLQRIVEVTHTLESLFRAGETGWSRERLDQLFEAAAALRQAVDRVGSSGQDQAMGRLEGLRLDGPEDAGREAARAEPEGAAEPPAEAEPGTQEAESQTKAIADGTDETETGGLVRVPFERLDALLNEVGELVGARAALEEHLSPITASLPAEERRALEDVVEGLARVTQALQQTTLGLRLVPVRRVFERFPSVVRELARSEGKQVRLEIEGQDVEIDKSIADALAEPILHLVRNAVSHGIEPPSERKEAGKPRTGRVVLRAARAGENVRVEVEDDGAGLDRAAIAARARELGLIGGADPADEELRELLFAPGFSTRREASAVSGRGVGLDVVRRRAIALRGALTVEDSAAGGTRFVLQLPLTMSIIAAVVFEADGELLALPAAEVEGTLRKAPLERAGGTEVVRHREELVPVARAADLFGWNRAEVERPKRTSAAVVVRRGARTAAVLAHRLLDQRDLVIKAVPGYLGSLPPLSGVGLSPDGRAILLLDPGELLDLNLKSHRREKRAG